MPQRKKKIKKIYTVEIKVHPKFYEDSKIDTREFFIVFD